MWLTSVLSLANQILWTFERLRLLSKCCENFEKCGNSFKKEKGKTKLSSLFYFIKKSLFLKRENKTSKAIKELRLNWKRALNYKWCLYLIKIVIRWGGALLVQENKLRRIKVPLTRNLFLHFLADNCILKKFVS